MEKKSFFAPWPSGLGAMRRAAMLLLVMMLTATTAWAWSGEGNEDSPYQISTVADLIQLANDVNNGTTYQGFFFKLMNNIDFNDDASLKPTKAWDDDTSTEQNFPGIGGYNTADRTFNGTFNGNNKTISGIRIYSGGKDNTDKQRGLFGRIGSEGTVMNLTLSNARITGYTYTGGIAGKNYGKIENCHVTNTVCIHKFISDEVNDYHGGVAGHNSNSTGIITNCTSSAKLTVKEGVTAGYGYGGIVGYNSTYGKLRNNFVSGATIPAAMGNYHGAIAGRNNDGTMKNNYYTGCTVAGTENASNVGCKGADVTTDDGAIGICVLALGTNVTASGSTKEYNSITYYYGTVTLGYSGTVPTGGIVKYAVNGDYISGNEFTINCEANVTAVVVYPYADISGLTYHGSTFDILGNTYVTSGSYYEINDEQDLIDLANYVYAGNNCAGLTFKMTRDLDFTNMPKDLKNGKGNFLPIGFGGNSFYGHFDGQNHSITGLYFNSDSPHVGLFSIIRNSGIAVENVTLVNPNITAVTPVGGIVASMTAGTISNCAIVGGSITGSYNVGGIIGEAENTMVSGCSVIGTSITAGNPVGIIAGPNDGGLTISNCNYYNIANGLSICGSSNPYTDGGGNQQVYQVTLGEGVTAASPAFAYGNKAYYAENATVTLGHTDRPGYVCGYQSSDVTISNGAFTMPASDVTVTTTWTPDPAHFADNGDGTYTIKTATGWDVFCDLLADGETFSGKTVKLGDDFSVTRMAGSDGHRFMGTFDGQGNTLTVSYVNTDNNTMTAPFSYVDAATIRNLVVGGSITGSAYRAAGMIGETSDNLSHITNCVSSVNISGSRYIAGFSIGGNVAIEGCVFNGKIVGTQYSGGFVGWSYNGLAITNCLFAPQDGSNISGGTFYYNGGGGDITPTNSYYTTALGTPQGKAKRTVTAGEDVTISAISPVGDATATYSVSGITSYGTGIKYGSNLYAGSGDEVSLTLSPGDREGYTFDGYTASAGTLSGDANPYTLTMPDENVTIGATFTKTPVTTSYVEADGTLHENVVAIPLDNTMTTLAEGWYVVNENVDYTGQITLGDDVNLILADGKTMTASGNSHGIYGDGPLTIYGQALGTGILTVTNTSDVGIRVVDDVTINGGTVTTTGIMADGNVTITGGKFTATDDPGICSNSGAITLGWTNATDYITAESYSGAVKVADGQTLTDGTNTYSGTLTDEQKTAIAEKTLQPCLALADNADNTTLVNNYDGKEFAAVQLSGRTLWKDGDWNTLCLPFDLALAGSPLEGADVRELISSTSGLSGTTLTLNFTAENAVTELKAGKPYIIKWASGSNIENPVFTGVTIDKTYRSVTSSDGYVTFKGTYDRLEWNTENKSILFVGAGNTLYWPTTGGHVNACRAYFDLGTYEAREFVLNFEEGNSETTSISEELRVKSEEFATATGWYTLDGRKLNGKPTTKGLYIVNGRKVVVK
jgi:hypothetical protein